MPQRTLRLNPKWTNPSGEWRVGIKRAYELFPKLLVTRVKAERRKDWDKKHLAAEVSPSVSCLAVTAVRREAMIVRALPCGIELVLSLLHTGNQCSFAL